MKLLCRPICSLSIVLVGCASVGSTGRYFQFRNPMTGLVVAQVTYPTRPGCAFVLRGLAHGDDQGQQAAELAACSDVSASKELHAIATLRDTQGSYLFDIETGSIAECTGATSNMIRDSKGAIQMVADCKTK
jgi:hypothetical protein